ncbi:MAG: hypothetical protein R3F16_16510 [Myxococcota bacterium]
MKFTLVRFRPRASPRLQPVESRKVMTGQKQGLRLLDDVQELRDLLASPRVDLPDLVGLLAFDL